MWYGWPQKAFSFISSQDHCQRASPSEISNTSRTGFKPVLNLSSGLVEWSCAVVIITTPRRHKPFFGIKLHFYRKKRLGITYLNKKIILWKFLFNSLEEAKNRSSLLLNKESSFLFKKFNWKFRKKFCEMSSKKLMSIRKISEQINLWQIF